MKSLELGRRKIYIRPQIKPWLLALRPKTLTAALVPIIIGSSLSYIVEKQFMWSLAFYALLSSFCIQIATNFVNDALDFKKGADSETRTGPLRMTQMGHLTSFQVMIGAWSFFLLAVIFGVPLVMEGGLPILLIGVFSVLCGYAYTGGPFPLAYKGLGDLFVIVFFGLVATAGIYYLHSRVVSMESLMAGLQIGSLATVLIAINNLRDSPQDALVGKRTLAVRFGRRFARLEISFFTILPFFLGFFWLGEKRLGAALLPLLFLPLAIIILRGIFREEPGPIYNRFLGLSALLHLGFGLCFSVGLFL